jgi:DNA-binding transcriptional ArsR family regulator
MEITQVEKILKALANRRRLKILKYLKGGKKASVTELSDHLKITLKATSKHLTVLKGVDLVESEQVSLAIFYCLSSSLPKIVADILSFI